jgi:acyl phosphate:glycerol-3-phosphate acyltransferase
VSYFIIAVAAYCLGSLSFAVIVSRIFGLPDPRSYGSNNPGATNVLRSGHKLAAALTLLGDALKGWLAVALTARAPPLLGGLGPLALGEAHVAIAALAVFLGHLFPLFYQFKGGKGVATALGVLLALDWRVGCGVALVWLSVFAVTRTSSLAALIATAAGPLAAFYFRGATLTSGVILLIAVLVIWRHRENIERIIAGREGHIDETKS